MAEPLKNLYNDTFFHFFCQQLAAAWSGFDQDEFMAKVKSDAWEGLELKARMRHLTGVLHNTLPGSYPEQLEILKKVAAPGFELQMLSLPDFVEQYGAAIEHEALSLEALKFFTPSSTAEFAIRPFIDRDPMGVMNVLYEWAEHEDHHVRRLASEGCRPRLPWGMALTKFKQDPALVLPVLDKLKHDESEYVRRSVANNLNDIAKDHPDLVLAIASSWLGHNHDTDRLVKHACRTLLKKGDARAMRLFGFADPARVAVKNVSFEPAGPAINQKAQLNFEISTAEKDQKLRVEYGVDFLKANGTHSRKVFKVSERTPPNGRWLVSTPHSFKQMTTRKHYPGIHRVAILINGVEKALHEFDLKAE